MQISENFRNNKEKYSNLPYPIIMVINRYLATPVNNLVQRHAILGDLFETILKLNAILALKDVVDSSSDKDRFFPGGLEFMKHPSLGHWLEVIRNVSKIKGNSEHTYVNRISEWYNSGKYNNELSLLFHDFPLKFPQGLNAVEGICSVLVTYRNKIWKGHGATITDKDGLNVYIGILEELISYLLSIYNPYQGLVFFYVNEVRLLSGDVIEAGCTSLNGFSKEALNFQSVDRSAFMSGEIYITSDTSSLLTRNPMVLSPLVEWQVNKSGNQDFFFFNDAQRTKFEYLCYIDGSNYYHREIKKEFEKITNINLDKTQETYDYIIYKHTEEERRVKADELLQKGREDYENGNFENAIASFEDSLEWFKSEDAIIYRCLTLQKLDEPPEYILNILLDCFEINPDNDEAKELRRDLEEKMEHGGNDKQAARETQKERHINPCYFDFFLPDRLRPYYLGIWFTLLSAFFGTGLFVIYLADPVYFSEFVIPGVLQYFLTLIMIFGIYVGKNKYYNSYYGLFGQLDGKTEKNFSAWFNEQFSLLFGAFVKDGKRYAVKWESEKFTIWFSIGFVLVWSLSTIPLQGLFKLSFIVALVQFLFSAMVWILVVPVGRYVIFSTLLIKAYSRERVNTPITRSANTGFNQMVSFYISNLILLDIFIVLLFVWNYMVVKYAFLDFVGLLLAVVVAVFWTMIYPAYIKRSLNQSKLLAIKDYQSHVRMALKRFLKIPEQNNLERLKWLLENESIVTRISIRVFTVPQVLLVVFSNLLILSVSVIYVLGRTGLLTAGWSDVLFFLSKAL